MSRELARLAGDRYYFTGEPCKRGHNGARYTSSGNCVECHLRFTKNKQTDARQQAQDVGDRYYFTGSPCKRGHLTARYTSTGNCVECMQGQTAPRTNARQQARQDGAVYYHTGKPCKYGHTAARYTSTGSCVECVQQQQQARQQAQQQRAAMTRQQAQDVGERYYHSGLRCAQGHSGLRYVPTDECIECIAPAMTHNQTAQYNLARRTLRGTAEERQHAEQQLLLCPPSEWRYWRKILAQIKKR